MKPTKSFLLSTAEKALHAAIRGAANAVAEVVVCEVVKKVTLKKAPPK